MVDGLLLKAGKGEYVTWLVEEGILGWKGRDPVCRGCCDPGFIWDFWMPKTSGASAVLIR